MLFIAFHTLVFIIMVGESLGCKSKTPPSKYKANDKSKPYGQRGKREVKFFMNNIYLVGLVPLFLVSIFYGTYIPKLAYVS